MLGVSVSVSVGVNLSGCVSVRERVQIPHTRFTVTWLFAYLPERLVPLLYLLGIGAHLYRLECRPKRGSRLLTRVDSNVLGMQIHKMDVHICSVNVCASA